VGCEGLWSGRSGGIARADGEPFSYYETIAGGAGASSAAGGASAVHTHMTNTRNTPIEAFEAQFPARAEPLGGSAVVDLQRGDAIEVATPGGGGHGRSGRGSR
jgi:N-methylhydantoinase B/oxoprolinase/acetone carboxylase alpha subunit